MDTPELAALSGVALRTLRYLEAQADAANPKLDTLERIAESLGVTVSFLVSEDGEATPARLRLLLEVASDLSDADLEALAALAQRLRLRGPVGRRSVEPQPWLRVAEEMVGGSVMSREETERRRAEILALPEIDERDRAFLREAFAIQDERSVAPRENPVSYPAQT